MIYSQVVLTLGDSELHDANLRAGQLPHAQIFGNFIVTGRKLKQQHNTPKTPKLTFPLALSQLCTSAMADRQFNLTVLISGNGSNLQALIDACASGALPNTHITHVISKY